MSKEIFGAFAALLALNGAAAAQPTTEQATTEQVTAAQPSCALPAVADSVALNDVPGSDLVTVPVEINGKPKQFLLDIGTNASEVTQAAVDELHLTPGLKRMETLQTAPASQGDVTRFRILNLGATSQITMVDVKGAHAPDDGRTRVNIPSFTLGTATGHNLQFVVANDIEIPKSASYDGLMTGSFFKQYDVELDFYGAKLNYLTPTTCTDPHQVVFWPHADVAIIPTTIVDGKIEVQVAIQRHQINAVLDTSSPHTIMRRDIADLTLGLKANTEEMMPAGNLDGMGLPVYRRTFPQISFAGGVTAYNVPALIQTNSMRHYLGRQPLTGSRSQFVDEPRIPALTLGMDVLHQLHVYFVPGQGKLYVTSAE